MNLGGIFKPDLEQVKNQIYGVTDCIESELVLSCHDISDGGLATALCEMTFENLIGCEILINSTMSNEKTLFSETGGFIMKREMKKFRYYKKFSINTIYLLTKLDGLEREKIRINNVN